MVRILARIQEYAAVAGLPNDFFIAMIAGMSAYIVTSVMRAAFGA